VGRSESLEAGRPRAASKPGRPASREFLAQHGDSARVRGGRPACGQSPTDRALKSAKPRPRRRGGIRWVAYRLPLGAWAVANPTAVAACGGQSVLSGFKRRRGAWSPRLLGRTGLAEGAHWDGPDEAARARRPDPAGGRLTLWQPAGRAADGTKAQLSGLRCTQPTCQAQLAAWHPPYGGKL